MKVGEVTAENIFDRVTHGFAENNGVKIHYVTMGSGTPIVMIHGFPDFWYTWREQMGPLSRAGYQVVAIDQRGYNKSDKPKGVDQYAMALLVEDVATVIDRKSTRLNSSHKPISYAVFCLK